MNTMENELLLVGRPQPRPASVAMEIGRISFEVEDGGVRNVCVDGVEVIRLLYVTVRDVAWETIEPDVRDDDLKSAPERAIYTCSCAHRGGGIDFSWQGLMSAGADGSLEFVMDGVANCGFHYARIGLALLSPSEFAGLPFRVRTPAGLHGGVLPQTEIGAQAFVGGEYYPLAPAFSELSVIMPAGEFRFDLEGDLFELEDQRNWTDASFKTYSTPMSLGIQSAEAGQSIRQRLLMTPPAGATHRRRPAPERGDVVTLRSAHDSSGALPALGLCQTMAGRPFSTREQGLLRSLRLAHLRVDLTEADASLPAVVERAAEVARSLGTQIELAVRLSDGDGERQVEAVERLVDGLPVERVLAFQASELVTAAGVTERLRARLGGRVPVYGGTELYFAEVNRTRPDPHASDGIAFGITPQVHVFDERSLIETLPIQAAVVRSARLTFAEGVPLAITPVTLKPRFNPDAVATDAPEPGLPASVDVRQASLFCAAWTVGSIKYLAEAGVESVTYFGTAGWEGVIERDEGPALPELFHSPGIGVYPVYHVFRAIADMPASRVVPVESDHPLAVSALGLRRGDQTRLLVANLTPEEQSVRIEKAERNTTVRTLDETTHALATSRPDAWIAAGASIAAGALLSLRPYAIAVID